MLLVQNNVKPLLNMSAASPKLVKKGKKLIHLLAILLSAFFAPITFADICERERKKRKNCF